MDFSANWTVVKDVPPDKKVWPKEFGSYIVSYIDDDNTPSRLMAIWVDDIETATLEYEPETRGGFVYWSGCAYGSPWKELKNVTAWMKAPEAYG